MSCLNISIPLATFFFPHLDSDNFIDPKKGNSLAAYPVLSDWAEFLSELDQNSKNMFNAAFLLHWGVKTSAYTGLQIALR